MPEAAPGDGAQKVSLAPLKQFAASLPVSSLLREILLSDDDEVEAREFLGRVQVWLQLLRRPEALGRGL
ncbi:MAG: hypothetical protein QW835_02550 [Candidatus Hadarchaeum sp.]|uniref:hypothetical protein n=1 Tax=Candidatus Hadarchaeum sp. TaxID=2883567 RepID=UPI0031749DB3